MSRSSGSLTELLGLGAASMPSGVWAEARFGDWTADAEERARLSGVVAFAASLMFNDIDPSGSTLPAWSGQTLGTVGTEG